MWPIVTGCTSVIGQHVMFYLKLRGMERFNYPVLHKVLKKDHCNFVYHKYGLFSCRVNPLTNLQSLF